MESDHLASSLPEALAVYVPEDRRQAIARGETLPERMRGVALFADISGFTPFTEALVQQHGPQRGVEELTGHLEQIYSALVQQITTYRGSVIGYSGDAITCWFDQDDGHRAVAAALGMQQAMARRAPVVFPSGRSVSLAVKVAMVAGTARRFLVGDPSIQVLDVLGGAIAERLAAAAQLVCSGEVLADAEIVRRLAGLLLVGEQRQTPAEEPFALVAGLTAAVPPAPWPAIPPGALTAAQLRPWVLPAVYERIRRGHGQFLTELRPTVALFLRFGGLDYEHDPDAPARLDAYIHWVQAVLARYEGVLLDLTLGEKGSYLYATFGAPVVHEDDARRALMAALELRTPPPELAFIQPVPIGLNLGVMRTGPSGSTARRTYAVLGDAVNVAARLMEAAGPGEILATQRVVQRVAGLFQTEPMPALKAKGKAEPLSVHRVTGAAGHLPQAKRPQVGQMVGRAAERAQLDAALERLGAGQSGVVLIEGEAGIGKSRLLGDWAEQAAGRDLQILIGASDAIERFTPYHGWRSIFTRLFQWDTLPADPAVRRGHVLGLLRAVGLEERAPLLNVVLPLELHDNELTLHMTGKVRADNIHDVLVALLQQAAAQRPLLLVLEDAHWLDSASWALALAVLRQVSPLLLVLLTRPLPTPVPPEYQALLGQPDVLRLRLLPLPPEDAVALACQRLGVDALPEQVAALIRQRAEGLPFFCEELAYALRDAGVIRTEAGVCQIAPGVDFARLALPDTVEGVVTSRIDLLPPGQQLAVKVASVIGRMFTCRVLAEVHPVEADRLEVADYLDHLQRLDVTPLVTPAPDPTYIFKHIITQEVAYNLLLFAQRRQLHRAVAEWYERAFAADLGSVYPLLAHHWLSASEPVPDDPAALKAVEYLEKAGELALRSDANREAAEHFERLLAMVIAERPLVSGIPALRLARWHRQLGEAQISLGRLVEGERNLTRALAHLGFPMPGGSAGLALSVTKQLIVQIRNRVRTALGQSEPALAGQALEARRLACNIYERLELLYFMRHQPELMIYCALASVNLAEEIGPSPELAFSYSVIATAVAFVPAYWLAQVYHRLTLQSVAQIDCPLVKARAYLNVSGHLASAGQFAEIEMLMNQVMITLEQNGAWEPWGLAMEAMVRVRCHQGQFQRAVELAEQLYRTAKRRDNIVQQTWSLTDLVEAQVLLASGDEVPVLELEIKRLLAETGETGPYQKLYGATAMLHLKRGEWAAADEDAQKLLRIIANERPTSFGLLSGYSALAETYLGLWERRALPDVGYLQRQARAACTMLARYAHILPVGEPAYLRAQGWYAWLCGRARRARALWAKSLSRAQALNMPLEEARTRYELGRHLAADDPEGREHLARAQALLQRMGVSYYE